MPVQTVKIYPGVTGDLLFGGEATAAWAVGPTFDLVDDPAGAPDGLAGLVAASFSTPRTAYAEYGVASVPTAVSISAIRMKARVLATGTEDVWDLVVTGLVRPNPASSGSGGAHFHGSPVTITSEQGAAEVYHDIDLGEWTTDPNTSSAWTLSTLGAMRWGVRFAMPATSPAVNGSAKLDQIYLEVDVVAVAANIDGVRAVGSGHLRLFRREPALVEITGPALLADVEILELFGLQHPLGPAPADWEGGWAAPQWRRGLPEVIGKTYDLLGSTVKLLCRIPRLFWTRWWSTFLTDLGHSIDGQGIPLLHSGGGGITVSRSQVAYVERSGKPADGLIMAAAEHAPKYDRRGLLVESAGAVNIILNSTFSQGTGNTFDDWTKTETGTGTIIETAAEFQFDETGLRRGARLAVGASDASEAHLRPVVFGVSGLFRLRIRSFNMFGALKLSTTIVRSSDSFYYDVANETWGASPVLNRIDNTGGGFRDFQAAIDPEGAENITIEIGYFNEAGTAGSIAVITSVEVYIGAKFIGSDLPTTDSPSAAREADAITISNNGPERAWSPDFGSFSLTVIPLWDPADLAEGEEKSFWLVADDSESPVYIAEILFRHAATGDRLIFRVNDIEAVKAFTPTAGVAFRISARWSGPEGELGLAPYSHQIAANDVWGHPKAQAEAPETFINSSIHVGRNPFEETYADGFLSHADVSPLVLFDEELARRP